MDPTYLLVPMVNFVAAFLVLTTIPTIRRSPSLGILIYAIWITSLCVVRGTNTIIWAANVDVVAVVGCDFSELIVPSCHDQIC